MHLKLTLHPNARAFLEAAGEMLYARETVNNLMLGVSEQLIHDPEAYINPFFATVGGDSRGIQMAAVMTPPHNMILAGGSGFEEGVRVLIAYLQEHRIEIPGIIGPVQITDPFVRSWKIMSDRSHTIHMQQKVYELRTVRIPQIPPGHFRLAMTGDIPTITTWFRAFEEEALCKPAKPKPERVTQLVNEGMFFVWERDGLLTSMAMKTRPIAHSITVSGVYTPPEQRQHGYATALVARLSQYLLDSGFRFVNLFTDLANPTSNSIYRKIGFHPVCDFCMYNFDGKEQELAQAISRVG